MKRVFVCQVYILTYLFLTLSVEQVETLLKNQDTPESNKENTRQDAASAYVANTIQQGINESNAYLGTGNKDTLNFPESISPGPDSFQTNGSANAHAADGEFPWEMIGLGLDEPLPPQDVMDDL